MDESRRWRDAWGVRVDDPLGIKWRLGLPAGEDEAEEKKPRRDRQERRLRKPFDPLFARYYAARMRIGLLKTLRAEHERIQEELRRRRAERGE